MYRICDLRIFEEIIYQSRSKKIILYGKDAISKKVYKMLSLLDIKIDYYIDMDSNEIDVKHPYDLLYEDINNIYIIIPQDEKKALEQKFMLIDILGEKHIEQYCVTLYNDGGHSEWDTIDINLGFTRKKLYEEFVTSKMSTDEYYTIVTLGGSTTQYMLNWQIKCWSELLINKLKENGKNVRILCGGLAGYASSQELIKFIRDIPNLKPDMVISFSGFNDAHRTYLTKRYPFANQHSEMLLNDLKKIYKSRVKNLNYGIENFKSYSQQWLENMQIMHTIAKLYNINFLAFLQPHINVKNYKYSIEEMYNLYNTNTAVNFKEFTNDAKEFYKEIETTLRDSDYIINLKDIFDEKEDIFFDHCHVYEKGNQIIADNIYEHIKCYVNNKK